MDVIIIIALWCFVPSAIRCEMASACVGESLKTINYEFEHSVELTLRQFLAPVEITDITNNTLECMNLHCLSIDHITGLPN